MAPASRVSEAASRLPVVVARMLAPVFSVKHPEAYQSYTAVPLPLPSTLIGALGRALALEGVCGGSADCYREALHLAPVARPLSPDAPLTVSSITFRVRKILEEGGGGSGGSGGKEAKTSGAGSWYALYIDRRTREYTVTSSYIYALYVPVQGREEHVARLVSMIDRIGDSESHVVAEAVVSEAAENSPDAVNEGGQCFDVALVAHLRPKPLTGLHLNMVELGVYMTIMPVGYEASRIEVGKRKGKTRGRDHVAYLLPIKPTSTLAGITRVYEPSRVCVKPSAPLKPCTIRAWNREFIVPCRLLTQNPIAEGGKECIL